MQFFTNIAAAINNFSGSEIAGALAIVLEVVLRVVPSAKPLSILGYVENALTGLASVASAANTALNKLVPQNTTTPPASS